MAQIKDLKRLCVTYVDNDCDGCPLGYCTNYCTHFPCNMSDNLDKIVDNWVFFYPVKTYAIDFFEKFPNAPKDKDGTPTFCIINIYGDKLECLEGGCNKCWHQEMKGE